MVLGRIRTVDVVVVAAVDHLRARLQRPQGEVLLTQLDTVSLTRLGVRKMSRTRSGFRKSARLRRAWFDCHHLAHDGLGVFLVAHVLV